MTKQIRVTPAVLTEDPQALKNMLKLAATFTDFVQIDVMDGKFVPSRSIGWQQIAEVPAKIKWEAHLMVEQPEKQFANFKKAGAGKVVFHYESTPDPRLAIAAARDLGLLLGIAVNPETPVSRILPLTGEVDSVLFLSVHPGFYGAKFLPEVLDKIAELRQARPDLDIGIDGGIKENNIALIARSGVNEIFVGSAIFLQPHPGDSYRRLLALARQSQAGEKS
jgi:ribulose-phosphate 3-epimerase